MLTSIPVRSLLGVICLSAAIASPAQPPAPPAQPPAVLWQTPHFSLPAKTLYNAASAVTASDGTNITVLEDDDTYTFDEQGRLTHVGYVVYKLLTQKGAESWDYAAIGWEPWHQARPEIRARVITSDLAEHFLDPKTISESPARPGDYKTYSDNKLVHASLPAIAPGAVVELEFVERETQPLFAAGRTGWTTFGRESIPVAHSHAEFHAPAALPLRFATRLMTDVKPVRTEANGQVSITYDLGRLEGIDPAVPYLPPDVARFPEVLFSTSASWQSIASAYARLVDSRASSPAVQPIVKTLIAGKSSVEEKEEAILDYLDREIRYTGIEFGDGAIVPHDPADTLTKRYGDCKDKATLLVAMLRAAGIPSDVALLNAGSRMDVPADLPGMGIFDHAIVYVPAIPAARKGRHKTAPQPPLWIDATDRYARLGQLPSADQGRLALIIQPGTTALTPTPQSTSKDNVLFEQREIDLSENGPASVVEKDLPSGVFESRFRAFYADQPGKDTRDNLTNYVKAQYVAEKLTDVERTDPADLSRQFVLTIACGKARRGYTDLDSAAAAIRLDSLFSRLPDDLRQKDDEDKKNAQDKDHPAKPRTADWQLPDPYRTDWQYRIVPPPGFVTKALPKDTTIPVGPALITESFSTDKDGAVLAHIVFDTVKRRYTVAEATALRNKVADLIAGPAIFFNFEPQGQIYLHQGKVREALAAYRGLIALHPTEAVHHLQLAEVLLQAGMGEAARAEARQAVQLDPKSALAERVLAQILKHDLVGRDLRAGSDLAGAADAYRAAIKLDPDDRDTQANLALLLEYDPVGRRYGPGAHLKEAIAEYKAIGQDKLAEFNLASNLAFALFYNGQFADALAAAQQLNPVPKALIAACIAATQGSKAGLAEANRNAGDESTYKDTARTAGEMLMNMRLYPLAADFDEAGAAGDNAAQTMGLAAMLRKAQRHEEIKFANTPADVARRFSLLLLSPDVTEAAITALLSRNALAVSENEDPDEPKKVLDRGKAFNSRLARRGISLDVNLDLYDQLFDPKVEGNDATGYRVKIQAPGGVTTSIFVVKEDGLYKALDTNNKPNSIALEILDRIRRGDLKGAKTLLDWLREDIHLDGGDDPLGGPIFPRFWTRGEAPDAGKMKLAAAAILAGTEPTAAKGVALLEETLKSASGDTERTNIQLALCRGYNTLQDYANLRGPAAALLKQYPLSRMAFLYNIYSLDGRKRYNDALKLADERLKQLENDTDALQIQMSTESDRGDYQAARQWAKKLVDQNNGNAGFLNAMAWLALFTGHVDQTDIDAAVKSARMDKDNPSILHTLACLYAETGKTAEAYDLLIRGMDLLNLDQPNDDYWYAFGRIAEQYGERAIAITDYRKLSRPKRILAIPDSTYTLAQMRLKALGADTTPSNK